MRTTPILLDCTLRDGGYHNNWDFEDSLVQDYLNVIAASGVEYVEIGFRSLIKEGFKGGSAYSTDTWIGSFQIPSSLKIGVMINASEILTKDKMINDDALGKLFGPADESPVVLVRIACHSRDVEAVLPATTWLHDLGYQVAINLMQVADRTEKEITAIATEAARYPVDVLYFADSLGTLTPDTTVEIVKLLRLGWPGAVGVHTHDNMSRALVNSVAAVKSGASWVDGTLTGMGRGPGNARTELLILEFEDLRGNSRNLTGLLTLIRKEFLPMQKKYGWGVNPYYYLSGKYAIHPMFVQEMLNDSRYAEEDVLAAVDHIHSSGGKSFNRMTLDLARNFYTGAVRGSWDATEALKGREVLLLGSGPGVKRYREAIESFVARRHPVVIALNTQTDVSKESIDYRIASHPLRLLSDAEKYTQLGHPLIAPFSALPIEVSRMFEKVNVLDFGIGIVSDKFDFASDIAIVPRPLVLAYALGLVAGGGASSVFMAGFDGYPAGDPRNGEIEKVFELYFDTQKAVPVTAITPSGYAIPAVSIYAIVEGL